MTVDQISLLRAALPFVALRSSLTPSGISPATAEPAWHRRQRKQRSQARILAAVASARQQLAKHHGSAPMPRAREHAPQRLEQDWVCKTCTDSKSGKYRNLAWRKECNQCHVVKGKVFRRGERSPTTYK